MYSTTICWHATLNRFDTRLRTKKIAHSHAIDITAMHALFKIDDLSSELTVCKAASAVTHSFMCALSTCKTGTHIQIQAWSSRHVHSLPQQWASTKLTKREWNTMGEVGSRRYDPSAHSIGMAYLACVLYIIYIYII